MAGICTLPTWSWPDCRLPIPRNCGASPRRCCARRHPGSGSPCLHWSRCQDSWRTWGRGGRRTDIRPLLESIAAAESDGSIDIVHLLPAFARERLYRYPLLTALDLNRPALANCLWTALNFFNLVPDDRYLDVQAAIDRLQRDYYLVENGLELGDVTVLLDERGVIYHAVVHLADNLVFTKNGTSPMAPWVILPLDTVVDYYRLRSETPRLLHHRRKDR